MDLNIFKGDDFFLFGKLDISVFQKEENKYMYIPSKSGHQKHIIRNFILGELRRYVRICTQELSFVRVKNKFFRRLRLRGYKKLFLKRLFGKVKHSSRNSLLKLYPHQSNGGKFYSERKENEILERAEKTFHETFSNDFLNLMEDVLNSNSGMSNECDAIGINSCQNNCVVAIEVSLYLCLSFKKTLRHVSCFCFSVLITGPNPRR